MLVWSLVTDYCLLGRLRNHPQRLDRHVGEQQGADLMVARQHIASAQQDVSNTVAELDGKPDIDVDQHPSVREAKAQLDMAKLNLSYTTVVAPDDGVVTKVDDLQVGDFVNSGATVFATYCASCHGADGAGKPGGTG